MWKLLGSIREILFYYFVVVIVAVKKVPNRHPNSLSLTIISRGKVKHD